MQILQFKQEQLEIERQKQLQILKQQKEEERASEQMYYYKQYKLQNQM